jgi:putative Mn2+ efflux pump MntP
MAALLTVFLVSVDAFFIGLSLGVRRGFLYRHMLLLTFIIFAVSVFALAVAGKMLQYFDFASPYVIGGAFIALGIKNLFTKSTASENTVVLGKIFALGFVMSLDCAVSTTVFTIEYGVTLLIPIVITVCHLALLLFGGFVVKRLKGTPKLQNLISAACLLLVGLFKMFSIL